MFSRTPSSAPSRRRLPSSFDVDGAPAARGLGLAPQSRRRRRLWRRCSLSLVVIVVVVELIVVIVGGAEAAEETGHVQPASHATSAHAHATEHVAQAAHG